MFGLPSKKDILRLNHEVEYLNNRINELEKSLSKNPVHTISDSTKAYVLSLHAKKMHKAEIAKICGIGLSSVYRIINQHR